MAEVVHKPYVDSLHISVDYICIVRIKYWELILISLKSGFIGTGESSG